MDRPRQFLILQLLRLLDRTPPTKKEETLRAALQEFNRTRRPGLACRLRTKPQRIKRLPRR
jgi:hypothetical protein